MSLTSGRVDLPWGHYSLRSLRKKPLKPVDASGAMFVGEDVDVVVVVELGLGTIKTRKSCSVILYDWRDLSSVNMLPENIIFWPAMG